MRRGGAGFLERSLDRLLESRDRVGRTGEGQGFLDWVDPRVKLAAMLLLVVAAAASRNLVAVVGVLVLATIAALASRISLPMIALRAWLPALALTSMIATPAIFTTPGKALAELGPLTLTEQGLRSAAFLLCRVTTAVTLAFMLTASTPWPRLMAALRALRLPSVVVAILSMTHRYVFVLIESARDLLEGRRSRVIGTLPSADRRRLATSAAGALLSRSIGMSHEVHLAMQARGYRGEVRVLEESRLRGRDWALLGVAAATALAVAFWRAA